jgi:hypothetical protein
MQELTHLMPDTDGINFFSADPDLGRAVLAIWDICS